MTLRKMLIIVRDEKDSNEISVRERSMLLHDQIKKLWIIRQYTKAHVEKIHGLKICEKCPHL